MVVSDTRLRRTLGGVTSLGLHVVWCPECRRRMLCGPVAWRLEEPMVQSAAENGWEIVASEVMPDHVHLFVRLRPTDLPAPVARLWKGRTSRLLRQEFPWLRRNRVLWSTSYVAASVGSVSEATVKQYIEHQWDDPK